MSKFCNVKNQLTCSLCNGKNHFDVMCFKLDKNNDQKVISLSNSRQSQIVFLQTLDVRVKYLGHEKIIRCVIDSASQSSYVSKNIITELRATPIRRELIIHQLFGGNETQPKQHEIYSVEVRNLKRTFVYRFEALSEDVICGFIPTIDDQAIFNELKDRKIDFIDSFGKETDIHLLLGSDVIGQILTGNVINLQCDLTAVENDWLSPMSIWDIISQGIGLESMF